MHSHNYSGDHSRYFNVQVHRLFAEALLRSLFILTYLNISQYFKFGLSIQSNNNLLG